jgi:hypothetical protein
MNTENQNKQTDSAFDEEFIKKIIEQTLGKEKSNHVLISLLSSGAGVVALYFLVIKPMQDEWSKKEETLIENLNTLVERIEFLNEMIEELEYRIEKQEKQDGMDNGYFNTSSEGKNKERVKRIKMNR